jgi:formylmethanofuran dehydrogenase subunit A
VSEGRQFISQPEFDPQIEDYLRPLFSKVYTMQFDNYPVELERIRRPDIVACK